MSGLRPDATAIYNFQNDIREPGQVCVCVQPAQSLGYTMRAAGPVCLRQ